jgi:hypothetical protein
MAEESCFNANCSLKATFFKWITSGQKSGLGMEVLEEELLLCSVKHSDYHSSDSPLEWL